LTSWARLPSAGLFVTEFSMVKWFPALLAVTLLAGFGCGTSDTGSAGQGKGSPAREGRLEGTWRVVALESQGKPVPDARVKGMDLRWTFAGDTILTTRKGQPPRSGRFQADLTQKPPRLDLFTDQGPSAKAIYELAGDTLRVCTVVGDNPQGLYPTEFASRAAGPRIDLLTLRRQAP
jgi:uncharacterized protein (TIGR03067 family)